MDVSMREAPLCVSRFAAAAGGVRNVIPSRLKAFIKPIA